MNGTQTNDFLFPKEMEIKIKKKLVLKFIIILVLSNMSIYFLSSSSAVSPTTEEVVIYGQLITIRLRSFVGLLETKTPVTLYDSQNNLLSMNSFIIRKLADEGQMFGEKEEFYEVEVPQNDLAKVVAKTKSLILAYPQGLDLTTHKTSKRGPYEIVF